LTKNHYLWKSRIKKTFKNITAMVKRLTLFLAAYLVFIINSFGQGNFDFPIDKHDFGTVEESGPIGYEFTFTNTGTAPIVISDVRASCGCTTPSWPKEPIAPGGKGVIKAEYNTTGRIGTFNKSITITSNAVEPSKVLYIKGIVDPKQTEKPVYTEDQLKKSPKALLDKLTYNFGKVERGQKVPYKFTIKNAGKTPLMITAGKSACACITYKLDKESILPGKTGVLEVTYAPVMDGKNSDVLTLITNDLNNPKTQITLQAEVVESLTNQTPIKEDRTNVPFGK
jgi:hypothetical protein